MDDPVIRLSGKERTNATNSSSLIDAKLEEHQISGSKIWDMRLPRREVERRETDSFRAAEGGEKGRAAEGGEGCPGKVELEDCP